jgi:Predicted AAA-ATPase/PD-(D/E)XK nuclease superfamily
MKPLPQLPISRQFFAKVRDGNSLYIDKTEYIYNLSILNNAAYFLSRPRRFGKSLTLDTIGELFKGNKALFEGLWIADHWDWSVKHSVIRLSLDAIGHKDGLTAALQTALHDIAATFKLKLKKTTPGQLFQELIQKVAKKSKKSVVILIDEYDRPIVDYIDPFDYQKSIEHREILKEFFSILKDASQDIRLLFITGVTKFARVSIFSTLNHLSDLTLDPKYAALCGCTQRELETYFADFLKRMPPNTLELLKYWYNGYSWDGKTFLYNPFSLLNFFNTGIYENYWFQTGTPTFLVKLLSQRFVYQLEEQEVSGLILESFVLEQKDNLDLNSLLLQTGYLTIKEIRHDNLWDERTFILKHPNQEVKQAFNRFLLGEYTHTKPTELHHLQISRALAQNDVPRVIEKLNHLLQSVPDYNYVRHEEKFFHSIIHLIFTMVGTDVNSELHGPMGRMDTVVITKTHVFLFEFKVEQSADAALQYLKDKRYAEALRHRQLPIVGVGVSFLKTIKGIADHKVEML